MTRATLLAFAALLGLPAAAAAAAPPNDAPGAPGEFSAVTAENGTPVERQAVAELAEASADGGVPRCYGAGSFERTVWYRVPAADKARELRVAAAARTTDPLELAAFVGPAGGAPQTALANACGSSADAGEEQTAAVTLRVPAGRVVLFQVGRRGAPGTAEDERVVLALRDTALEGGGPAGDVADGAAPGLVSGASAPAALGGATLSDEDPAVPACPSLGSVWRRFVPSVSGPVTVTAGSAQASTLTVFGGARPTAENAIACVNRERSRGDLSLSVGVSAGTPVWVRVGTDRPAADATSALRLSGGIRAPGAGSGPAIGSVACAAAVGLRSVSARPSGRRVVLPFTRAGSAPVTVSVFQRSVGRRVVGEQLVARFSSRSRSVTWNGRANRRGRTVRDGYLVVRYTMPTAAGTDVRTVALRRTRGRFARVRAFQRAGGCGVLSGYALSAPVFGGPANRAVGITFRLAFSARVGVEVLRGRRVVRRFATRTRRGGVAHRLSFGARGRTVGAYRFRLTARSGNRTIRSTLTARRL